jgi:hypothetical protein
MSPKAPKIALALLLFTVCFTLYYATLAPTITWEHDGVDSGELITAANTLGIAHPPGYPLYVLLGKLFTLLPVGDIAYRVNLMSAFFAAASVTLVYLTALLLHPQNTNTVSSVIIAATSALLFAFSQTFWSQAIIAEVYSLNAFLVALMVYLVTIFQYTGKNKLLWIVFLTLGLSLGNHLSAFLFLPGMLFLVLRKGRPTPKSCLGMAGFFLLGLSIYLYLPVRAAQSPPINWGNPHTWSAFWWTVSGTIYSGYVFALPLVYLPGRIASWMNMAAQQFTWPGLALGLVGIWDLWEYERDYLIFSLTSFGALVVYALTYDTTDSYVYLIPSYLLFTLWIARGSSFLFTKMLHPWLTKRWGLASSRPHLLSLVSLSLLLLPMFLVHQNYPVLDLSEDRTAYDYAAQVFADIPSEALIIADTDAHIFSLWHFRYVVAPESEAVVLAKGLIHYAWYRENLSLHHPQVIMPQNGEDPHAQLFALIDANLPYRPIYLTDPDHEILTRYGHTKVGTLYKLGVKG